jgi:alkylation response protein AidB-like acyl-CoA dehydrogenase
MNAPAQPAVVASEPRLENTWNQDVALRSYLHRYLGANLPALEPSFASLGARAAVELFDLARLAEKHKPEHQPYDIYGTRVDRLHLSHAWNAISRIGVEEQVVATGHDADLGDLSRLVQLARLHLFSPSSAFVMCPMAMTDGVATVLKAFPDNARFAHAVSRLLSVDPEFAWSSGQWMTEIEGGSDVSRTATVARRTAAGGFTLHGTKFFTSATTANCALTLARIEGAPEGSRGLTMFYVEPWRADGLLDHVQIRRLKDKLGTRAMPTAELVLDGTPAWMVGEEGRGVRTIAGVLNIARYYNTSGAVSYMARGVQMSRAFAALRSTFGTRLDRNPLHVETLAQMQTIYEGGLAVAMRLAYLLGRVEQNSADADERLVWRILTPLAKLGTGKDVVSVTSETLEAFGGSGYMEDSGVPVLLRDAQVLPIWEGTTNVLSLDMLRAAHKDGALPALLQDTDRMLELSRPLDPTTTDRVASALRELRGAIEHAMADEVHAQRAARAMSMSLYRVHAAALLLDHASASVGTPFEARSRAVAQRWAALPMLSPMPVTEDRDAENLALLG